MRICARRLCAGIAPVGSGLDILETLTLTGGSIQP
jgi:hypothetical protein